MQSGVRAAMKRPAGEAARRKRRTAVEAEGSRPAVFSSRMRILEGAAEAFGSTGYDDARVEDILAASGVSRPTFYKFFRNKDEVFNALVEMTSLSLIQAIKSAVATATEPVPKLERAVEAY